MTQPSLIVVDDQTVFREMLVEVLTASGMQIVGQYGTGAEALAECANRRPDVVVLDVVLPDMSGLDVLRKLQQSVDGVSVLLVTAHEKPTIVKEAVARGARGVVTKSAPLSELKEAVRRVAGGGVYFCEASTELLHDGIRQERNEVELTARERQILQMVALGNTSKEIAARLSLAEKTVINHRANIRDKLGFRDIASLTRYAIDQGLVEPKA